MDSNEPMGMRIEFLKALNRLRRGDMIDFGEDTTKGEGIILLSAWDNMRENNTDFVRVSTIVNQLSFSPQSISRILRSLESRGMITRTADKVDRRNTVITLTEHGKAHLNMVKENANTFCDMVIARMGDEDMKEFLRLAEKCNNIMEETASRIMSDAEVKNYE